jgi:hypothetical protein
MKNIICIFKGHKRGETTKTYRGWKISCSRCGFTITYNSPSVRLVATEKKFGFTGD